MIDSDPGSSLSEALRAETLDARSMGAGDVLEYPVYS